MECPMALILGATASYSTFCWLRAYRAFAQNRNKINAHSSMKRSECQNCFRTICREHTQKRPSLWLRSASQSRQHNRWKGAQPIRTRGGHNYRISWNSLTWCKSPHWRLSAYEDKQARAEQTIRAMPGSFFTNMWRPYHRVNDLNEIRECEKTMDRLGGKILPIVIVNRC